MSHGHLILLVIWRPPYFCASGRGPPGPALGTALSSISSYVYRKILFYSFRVAKQ
jgi:hypothetical protein